MPTIQPEKSSDNGRRCSVIAIKKNLFGGYAVSVTGRQGSYVRRRIAISHQHLRTDKTRFQSWEITDAVNVLARLATEPHPLPLARGAQARFAAAWGLGETGAAGPTGNRYGQPAGHTYVAVARTVERAITLETSITERLPNCSRRP